MNFPGRKNQRRVDALGRYAKTTNFKNPDHPERRVKMIEDTQAKLQADAWNIKTKKRR